MGEIFGHSFRAAKAKNIELTNLSAFSFILMVQAVKGTKRLKKS